jgi:Uma2 family endonuclease
VLVEAELVIGPDMVKRPDIQVVSENLVGGQSIVGVPDLVVEIHSSATRVLDLTEKRFVYAAAKIPSYWLIDPDTSTLTILGLKDNAYEEVAVVTAPSSHDVTIPFAMRVDGSLIFE